MKINQKVTVFTRKPVCTLVLKLNILVDNGRVEGS